MRRPVLIGVRAQGRAREGRLARLKHTSITGSCPRTPTFKLSRLISTTRSRALRFPGTVTNTSSSEMVCVHLYGRAACSSASLARAAASSAGVGSGKGVKGGSVNWGAFLFFSFLFFFLFEEMDGRLTGRTFVSHSSFSFGLTAMGKASVRNFSLRRRTRSLSVV